MTTYAPPFDTHRFIKHLTDSGVGETQAEAHAKAINEALTGGVATSALLEAVEARLEKQMAKLETRIAEQEPRLTIRMGGGLIALAALIAFATDLV